MRRNRQAVSNTANRDRWIVSYADFITLLFGFFVMMYAVSSVNDGQYRLLSKSIVEALADPQSANPANLGNIVSGQHEQQEHSLSMESGEKKASEERYAIAQDVVIKSMADTVKKALSPWIDMGIIGIEQSPIRLEIQINASVLFDSGSARLAPDAEPILEVLSDILEKFSNAIHVEGFTDNQPISNSVFPSNWELSSARASSVLRMLVSQGIAPDRMAAIGYGEFRPVADNDNAIGRNQNRRVVIVVLSGSDPRDFIEILSSTKDAVDEINTNLTTEQTNIAPDTDTTLSAQPEAPPALSTRIVNDEDFDIEFD